MNIRILLLLVILTIPSLVAGQENNALQRYQPLAVGIPGVTDTKGARPSLVQYLNALFSLLIAIAAVLAVIRIVIAGFSYMTTDAWGSKEEAVSTIRAVVIGLIVLLLSVVILKTLNPDLLRLDILQFN
jgi:hypothetical protein